MTRPMTPIPVPVNMAWWHERAARTGARQSVALVAEVLYRYVNEPWVTPTQLATLGPTVHSRAIAKWVRLAGLPVRPPGLQRVPHPLDIRDAVRAYERVGTLKGASRELGCNVETVKNYLRLAGVGWSGRVEATREALSQALPVPAGFVTVPTAERMIGRSDDWIRTRLEAGVVDGARREPRRPGDVRDRWLIPERWVLGEVRSPDAPTPGVDAVFLPIDPLVEALAESEVPATLVLQAAGLSPRRWSQRRASSSTVGMTFADAVAQALGRQLAGDIYEQGAVDAALGLVVA